MHCVVVALSTCCQDEHVQNDPDARVQPDGSVLYVGPKGRMETLAEREKRLQHNKKMVFNRSLSFSA